MFIGDPRQVLSGDHVYALALLNLMIFVVALSMIPIMVKYLPLETTAFSVLVMLQGATSLQSLGRYLLPAIGVYFALAVVVEGGGLRRTMRIGLTLSSLMLMTMLAILFAQGRWVI